jgi:hypothetical protein
MAVGLNVYETKVHVWHFSERRIERMGCNIPPVNNFLDERRLKQSHREVQTVQAVSIFAKRQRIKAAKPFFQTGLRRRQIVSHTVHGHLNRSFVWGYCKQSWKQLHHHPQIDAT